MIAHTLYICYFGVREPLVQTQVIPYLRGLVKDGHSIALLTFEPAVDERERGTPTTPSADHPADEASAPLLKPGGELRAELAAQGIEWHWLRYHKRPSVPATFFDVLNGARYVLGLIRRDGLDILHARSHVPMLMAALARKLSRRKPKILFDIRGFFPEEYTDAGIWPEDGLLYRTAKRIERWLMKEADGFVVLTEKAREILFGDAENVRGGEEEKVRKGDGVARVEYGSKEIPHSVLHPPHSERPVEVIPCCVDLHRFETANSESRRKIRAKLGFDDRFVAVYVGSFGGWYMAEETADFLGALKKRKADAFALILSQSKPEMIEPLLREQGYSAADYLIRQVGAAEIPLYLSAADAAISFIKPCFSKQASSPTKNAEYLACGLPIVVNDGIGDTSEFTTADQTGVVLLGFSSEAYERALDELDKMMADREALSNRCRASARKRFDLETVGGTRYRRIYQRLLETNAEK